MKRVSAIGLAHLDADGASSSADDLALYPCLFPFLVSNPHAGSPFHSNNLLFIFVIRSAGSPATMSY
jgi:hypothetical protein